LSTTTHLRRVTRFAGHLHCETKQLKQLMASEWFAGLHQIQATSLNANAAVFAKALSSLPNLHTFEAKGFNPQTIPTDLMRPYQKPGSSLHCRVFGFVISRSVSKDALPLRKR